MVYSAKMCPKFFDLYGYMGYVEEFITDSVSVDLGICNIGAIGNNELVVAVQR